MLDCFLSSDVRELIMRKLSQWALGSRLFEKERNKRRT
jgi:hypothetical protein